jgi:hypothetical protein
MQEQMPIINLEKILKRDDPLKLIIDSVLYLK